MMKRSGSGRIARKVGAYDEESSEGTGTSQSGPQKDSVVKRPNFAKSKKRSSLRISFGPGDTEGNDDGEMGGSAIITPKKTNLSRLAIEKNAERKARSPLGAGLPQPRASLQDDRPSYSRESLVELRNSTPTIPKDLQPASEEKEEESRALDIASKFGPSAFSYTEASSAIPTEAEIQEKKARRARLAQEHKAHDEDEDKPWASDCDDEFRASKNEILLRPKDKYAETRLVRDDEDIAEGFDEYVEDERISLGKKAEREAKSKRRAEMQELIDNAEQGSDDDGSEDSEAERNAAYEAAQTRAGAYGRAKKHGDDGARTPPRITPLPDLGAVVDRLQADVRFQEERREMALKKLEELNEEKVRIAERQKYLQEQLQKTGDDYEKLRLEAGMAALPVNGTDGGKLVVSRGLDSLGTTPLGTTSLGTTPVGPRSEEESDNE